MKDSHEIYAEVPLSDGRKTLASLHISTFDLSRVEETPKAPATIDLLTRRFKGSYPDLQIEKGASVAYKGPVFIAPGS
jgi:hypothetical protein